MSFSFSNKFSVKKDDGGTDNNATPQIDPVTGLPVDNKNLDAGQKRRNAAKQNPLLNAKTDDYADDNLLYTPKITAKERFNYFNNYMKLNKNRKNSDYAIELEEIKHYPRKHVWIFGFIRSHYWDQLYLNLFLIWLVLIIALVDGWAKTYAPMLISLNANNNLLLLPPVFMLICQVIPLVGIIYYMHYGYDLVHYLASVQFQTWSFVACLLAQYIEYFHYGGRGRRDEGHLIRIGSVNKPSKIKTFMLDYMKRIAARGAKIYAGAESESEEEEGLEEDNESEDDEETGQPKAKKVVINVKDANSDTVRPMSPSGKELALTSPNISRPSSPSRDQQQQHALTTATANGEKKGATDVEQPPEVEENPEDYHDWSCIVCNTANHALKYNPNAGVEIYFGEKGAFYKHMYAHLIFQTTKPRCKKCYTVFDYKPPPGSAHIFPHNPDPHTAFKVYPKPVRVQNGLKTDKYSIYYNYFISLLFGLKNNIKSMPTINDWRLKKYIIDHFPKIPKYELKSDERYEVGEILECKLQKSEYYRARIIYVHPNGTYNIRFDQGDELRFVQRHDLRLGTEKRAFAYRVELGLVIMVVSFPLCLILAIMSGDMGIVFLSMFLISLLMFITRIKMLIQYAVNFYQAGICVIGRLSLFYILPVFFFFLTSAVGLTSGGDPGSWGSIVALAIMMKVFAIPVIYAQRPFYAIMASSIFLQTSIGLILLSSWGTAAKRGYIAIPLAPFITTILTFKYYRKHLHNIWDACLIIRRASDDSKNNPSIFLTCWFYLSKAINYIKMLQGY